ncbi:MAG: acetoin utilization protein AcuC [Planctomycetota bacterium]|jgi:acetoin utilization protein AcuC
MKNRRAFFIHSPLLEEHPYPSDCPFNTSRAGQVRRILDSMGLLNGKDINEVAPEPAGRMVLKKFHSARYLQAFKNASNDKFDVEALRMGLGTPDCPIFKGMYEYAVLACGATLKGVDLILSGQADVAFNPSGGYHHAGPERASGFCYINDIALGCLLLSEAGKKILYLDVDVHFGNGVAYAFYDRKDVMTISFHQNPRTLFPGTGFEYEIGEGDGKGYCVNVPLPVGAYDQVYLDTFKEIAVPLITKFNPDVIAFELGADALAGDPLANLYLTNNAYVDIINSLLKFKKPILVTGGGGYNISNTVRAWALAWTVLAGLDINHQMSLGMGSVMLESTDWQGGLRDRELSVTSQQRQIVQSSIRGTVSFIKENIFPIHGL